MKLHKHEFQFCEVGVLGVAPQHFNKSFVVCKKRGGQLRTKTPWSGPFSSACEPKAWSP